MIELVFKLVVFFAVVGGVGAAVDGDVWTLAAIGAFAALWVGTHVLARLGWNRAARSIGLEHTAPGPYHIAGRIDGYQVSVESFLSFARRVTIRQTRFTVNLGAPLPSDFTITANRKVDLLGRKRIEKESVQTGDEHFDVAVTVVADEPQVLARLSDENRRVIWRVFDKLDARLRDRAIYLEMDGLVRSTPLIAESVKLMVLAAKALSLNGRTIPEALLANVHEEREEPVRDRNLLVLLERFARTPQAREAADTAVQLSDPLIRLLGAIQLGEGGYDEIERILVDEEVSQSVRIRALDQLSTWSDRSRALLLLDGVLDGVLEGIHERLLGGGPTPLRLAAIRGLGEIGGSEAIDRLMRLTTSNVEKIRAAVAEALDEAGAPTNEPVLIATLHHPRRPARWSAVQHLRSDGTIAAVEPLLDLSNRTINDSELKAAAHKAIDKIQSRLGDVDGGRLSLSEIDAEAGGLSLAADEGALSVAEEDNE